MTTKHDEIIAALQVITSHVSKIYALITPTTPAPVPPAPAQAPSKPVPPKVSADQTSSVVDLDQVLSNYLSSKGK